ncbi:MAG: pyridoxamine 5'-phosphate oxidase family protein [Elainella sp. Prado103]|jgi:PPOX class probable FMN-dependent enzyme|nr:pyridoxamine 5'-phosphate oxidase family protein [Elainella sp. Prado103]
MLPPWRSPLARALHRNRSLAYARYLQLATVTPDGRPTNRTIVFRGFLESTGQLKFITDDRSEKVTHLHTNPWGEACWYFPKTREQFRLLGQLILISADSALSPPLQQARQQQWQELSDAARLQFAWPQPRQPRTSASQFNPPPPDPIVPVANFCLLLLDPTQVDHLELRGDPQNRYLYRLADAGAWEMQAVNP